MGNLHILEEFVSGWIPFWKKHKVVKDYIMRNNIAEMEMDHSKRLQYPHKLCEFLKFDYLIKARTHLSGCPTAAGDGTASWAAGNRPGLLLL